MLEKITHDDTVLAMIMRKDYHNDGVQFLTPNDYSQQLGYMGHPAGYKIPPHIHNVVAREISKTQEVLIIRKGRIKIDFYSSESVYLESKELYSGDIILIADGGHGITVLEPTEMVEVKTGPYVGEMDKKSI